MINISEEEKLSNSLKFMISEINENQIRRNKLKTEMEIYVNKIYKIDAMLVEKNSDKDVDCLIQKKELLSIDYLKMSETYDMLTSKAESLEMVFQLISKQSNFNVAKPKEIIDQNIGFQILEAQELERQRIANELHDIIVQDLAALVHNAELCIRYIDMDVINAKLELVTMMRSTKEDIDKLRNIIYDMKPMLYEDMKFSDIISKICDKIRATSNIKDINLFFDNELENINAILKISLYRVILEAVNNIIKHSKANRVDIKLKKYKKSIKVSIIDDGIGFDFSTTKKENTKETLHFGMSIMNERVRLLHGKINVYSKENYGTKINILIPNNH